MLDLDSVPSVRVDVSVRIDGFVFEFDQRPGGVIYVAQVWVISIYALFLHLAAVFIRSFVVWDVRCLAGCSCMVVLLNQFWW